MINKHPLLITFVSLSFALLLSRQSLAQTDSNEVVGDETQPSQEDLALDAERALDQFLRGQKILFMRGELELEWSTVYSSDSGTNVRVGGLVFPELTSRSLVNSMLARYAWTDDLEVNLLVPLVYAESDPDSAFLDISGQESAFEEQDDFGLGDIRGGVRYQLWREQDSRPDLALAFYVKSDTGDDLQGTGNWDVGARTTFVKTMDPVVFFGGFGYTATLESDDLDRGDEVFIQFGTGFSVNDRVSYNLQVVGRAMGKAEFDGQSLDGTDREVVGLQFGTTTLARKNLFFEPFVNVGLTEDAPDVVLGINIPYRLKRRFPLPWPKTELNQAQTWFDTSLASLEQSQRVFPRSTESSSNMNNSTDIGSESERGWTIRIGTYTKAENANRVYDSLREEGFQPSTTRVNLENGLQALRVWLGPFPQQKDAKDVLPAVEQLVGSKGLITCLHCIPS